jgi:chemotaxis protein CheC
MIDVSELQRDALAEIFNIGVGRAAASLSLIVNDEIELSAPNVLFLPPAEVQKAIGADEMKRLSIVTQDFRGHFDARAMLLFPEKNALTIVAHMLGEQVPPEQLSELEQEAMCEVGNIILNACVSALADLLRIEFDGGLPHHRFADSHALDLFGDDEEHIILVVQVDLTIHREGVNGRLLLLLSVSSLRELIAGIDRFLGGQGIF